MTFSLSRRLRFRENDIRSERRDVLIDGKPAITLHRQKIGARARMSQLKVIPLKGSEHIIVPEPEYGDRCVKYLQRVVDANHIGQTL